ncbi:MAG: hypothetical protein QM803_08090 [Rhodocyclaceae bacterium]
MSRICLALIVVLTLAACEQLGIPDPRKDALQKEAEGKAIGGACRQSGRALEDCYAFNPNATKAAIFTGWREMNDYMTENKLDIVKPQVEPTLPANRKKRVAQDDDADSQASAPAAADQTSARASTAQR